MRREAVFVFNGRTCARVEDMPPEVRRAYEETMAILPDEDKDGVPDIFEGEAVDVEHIVTQTDGTVSTKTRIIVDGQEYSSVSELPPEAREKYEQAMAKMRGMMGPMAQGNPLRVLEEAFASRKSLSSPARTELPSVRAPQEESTTGRFILLAGVLLVLLLVLVAVAALLLSR